MKIATLMTASVLCFSSLGILHAQDQANTMPSNDLDTGTDAMTPPVLPVQPGEIAPPTTPNDAGTLEQSIYGEDQALNEAPAEPEAQGRPWKFNLHASVGSYYDDNIFISSTDRKSDFVTLLTAGGGFTLGDYTARKNNYLIADYTGIGEIFARNSDQDAYEQKAFIQGQVVSGHITLNGTFNFEDLADDNIDIGTRARTQIYTGVGSARYDISDKTYVQAMAQVTVSDYAIYLGSNDERGGLSFDYLPDPDVVIGLGAMGGVLNVENSSSQTYEQILASLNVAATGKFSLISSAGVEDRQTSTNNGLISPVFEIDGNYTPFEGLDLTLGAFRRVMNSAFYAGSDYIATGVDATAAYELSARFTLMLDAGYTNADYRSVSVGPGISRTDNYLYVRPAFRYTASAHWNVQLYYFYRNNDSTVKTSSFKDTQAGLSINFSF